MNRGDVFGRDGKARTAVATEQGGEDGKLEQALRNFRLSVHAWSDAELNTPRTIMMTAGQRSWRLAAGCALGLVLIAGGVSGGVYQHHRRVVEQAMRHQNELRHQIEAQPRLVAQQKARPQTVAQADSEADLLAKVDSDVSREVPAAMEPLAQLMAESGNQ